MPCVVTRDEEIWYEKQGNKKIYGKEELNSRISTRVACELAKIIEENNLSDKLSNISRIWIERHKAEDNKRK